MYIGAAYYPELWAESELEKDIERCWEMKINTLRVGEFAWGKMEPQEGCFDLDWLSRVVDRLYEAGIYTVMCTPTCTPPRWLLNKYPETVQVSFNEVRDEVSSRCHPCKTSPIMREKNRLIVTELAKRFGNHKGIIGWQIDNELLNYGGGCYCDLCKQAFRKYLDNKYGSVEALNDRWGMARWSLEYKTFDDVLPPRQGQWRHPSLRTEWRNFQCEQIFSYINEQADILHQYTTAPIGTDMMPTNVLSYYRATEKLDVVQFNHYDAADKIHHTLFSYDFLRPIKNRPFWVTETQVGWNGSEYAENGYRPVGNCYINTWLPIAKGGEMNLYWLFRTHPQGHEIAHGALFSSCGRPYRVSEEARQAAEHIERCRDFLDNSKVCADVAIHYSSVAENNFSSAPILKGMNYRVMVETKFYSAFRHCNIDVIDTPHGLEGYKTVISPFLTTIDDDTKNRIVKWVENGGTWIVGPMSDIMTDYSCKSTDAPFFFLEELAGVYTKYQKPIANSVFKARWNDGEAMEISEYYDAFETTDSRSLAQYSGDEFDGLSVVTERHIGKGRVIMLGSVPSHKDLRKLTDIKNIAEASDNVVLIERSGDMSGIIALEIDNRAGYVVLDGQYVDIISGVVYNGRAELTPYSVLVLKRV